MMMKIKLLVSFFVFVYLIISCSSKKQFSVSEFLEQSGRKQLPTQNEFPEDGAVYLHENTESKMFFDDKWIPSIEETYASAILYFNDKAEHYLTPVIYLDKKDKLISFMAKTIKPNGEILELTKDDLHQTTLNLADFTDNKSLKFTFPGIESGCVMNINIL